MTEAETVDFIGQLRTLWRADRRWESEPDFAVAFARVVAPHDPRDAAAALRVLAAASPEYVPQPAQLAVELTRARADRRTAEDAAANRGRVDTEAVPLTDRYCQLCGHYLSLLVQQHMITCWSCNRTAVVGRDADGKPRVRLTPEEVRDLLATQTKETPDA